MISFERLKSILATYPSLSIGLVGDLFLDRYLEVDSELNELSIETGLEAYQVTRIRNSPGALGTVLNNLAALGVGRLTPVTVIGDDGQSYDLLKALGDMPVDLEHIIQDATRCTPTYTKPLKRSSSGDWVELNRIDLRNRAPLSSRTQATLLARIRKVFETTDGLIVLDQVNEEGWGVVTPATRELLGQLADEQPDKLMFVDSRAHIGRFSRGVLKPNLAECLKAMGLPPTDDRDAAIQAASKLSQRTGLTLFCTLGADGILIVEPGKKPVQVPGYPATGPIDIVGAGDSATSGIVTALLASGTIEEAATVGNLVASITVEQLGTTGTATPQQVLDRWQARHGRLNSG